MNLTFSHFPYGSKLWVGVILCNNFKADEYKIMLSDAMNGVFRGVC